MSWSALWRREGGGDEAVTDARGVFYPPGGEEAAEMSLFHLFGQEGSSACLGFLFVLFQYASASITSSRSLLVRFAYFFNPQLSTLIPNGLNWDTRQ